MSFANSKGVLKVVIKNKANGKINQRNTTEIN